MKQKTTFYGLRWWALLFVIAVVFASWILAAQHHMEQPQLVSFSGQPVYNAEGGIAAFPITLTYRQTEKRFDGKKPESWITTDTFDLVKQELHTMALGGNTMAYGAVREDLINVLGALYRSVHPPPMPQMQNSAFRGERPDPK